MNLALDKIIVAGLGLLGVGFTYWFFLMKKNKVTAVTDKVEIVVQGGYSPEVISIPKNKKTVVTFIRRDPSSCLEEVVMPDFKIRKSLPLNQPVTLELTPPRAGEFNYTCGMGMFHGKIIVK